MLSPLPSYGHCETKPYLKLQRGPMLPIIPPVITQSLHKKDPLDIQNHGWKAFSRLTLTSLQGTLSKQG